VTNDNGWCRRTKIAIPLDPTTNETLDWAFIDFENAQDAAKGMAVVLA